MNITTNKQHRDVHIVTVDQEVMLRIIAERVAEKVGVHLDGEGVTWRAYVSSRDTGARGFKYDVAVEIIDDHAGKAVAAPMKDL